ncbi:hypothetical protein Ancab_013740 [Ancistrocladus abbreviatus]
MRIRKRQVPLPLSLLSPVPISDPQLFSRSPVHPDSNQTPPVDHHDYDRPRLVIGAKSDSGALQMKVKERVDFEAEEDIGRERTEKEKNNHDISKRSMLLGADDNNGGLLQPPQISFSNEVVARWRYGDKTVPLKKRIRGSFESSMAMSSLEDPVKRCEDKEEKISMTKCKINKKWVQENGIDDDEEHRKEKEEEEEEEGRERKDRTDHGVNNNNTATIQNNNTSSSGGSTVSTAVGGNKKSKRGSTIMEGSRCSRVNGRGWRCCQPTLVGYSLCEHHLGKGRLRSVTSMRNSRTLTSKKAEISLEQRVSPTCATNVSLYSHGKQQEVVRTDGSSGSGGGLDRDNNEDVDDVETKEPLMLNSKKRMKLGMVKARSLSSLLGRTNSTTSALALMEDHENGGRINI